MTHDAVETGYHKTGPTELVRPSSAELVPPPPQSTGLSQDVIQGADPADAGPSPYDDPEFLRDLKEGIAAQIEGWQKDWSVRLAALMEALDLSRPEAMLYLLLLQQGKISGLATGFQQMWNAPPALNRRHMEDTLLEMELRIAAAKLDVELVPNPTEPIPEQRRHAARGWKIQ